MSDYTLADIPLNSVRESEILLRNVDKKGEGYVEMVDSVKNDGILNPILVRELKDDETGETVYAVVEGNHRYNAACDAGLDVIPAKIMSVEDSKVLELQIIGNVQKVETKPQEYSRGLRSLLEMNPTLTMTKLSGKLSKSITWLNQRLGLLNLSEELAELVNEGTINVSNAYALSKLPPEEQINFKDDAQIMTPQEFVPKCADRVKEINKARRQGRMASAEFNPVPHLRGIGDIKGEFNNPTVGTALVSSTGTTDAAAGFALAISWILNMDPDSVSADKEKFDSKQSAISDKREKATAARLEKREQEMTLKTSRLKVERRAIEEGADPTEALKLFDDEQNKIAEEESVSA